MPFDQTLYAPPLPTSGVILGLILNILNGYLDYSQPESTTNWQRIVESFKYGFAKRTELGDPSFVEMDAVSTLHR
jgi:gamma-glutamyltranspeptidase/glutathione hydrolase/leukotriene-C4 hydrolase